MHRFRAVLGASCAAALTACGSDPAAQAPVAMQPGLYAVSLSGEMNTPFHRSTDKELQKDVCVSGYETDSFPGTFPRKYFSSFGPSCAGSGDERVGNRISGAVTCPLADGAQGELTLAYDGDVAEQALDVRAKIKLANLGPEADGAMDKDILEDMALHLQVQRTGDCPA